ncbi:hypothetical protein BDW62DRAFT_213350 [Aspergillus aurantiobrunneus]
MSMNLLEYLRCKTQVDLDSFDVTVTKEFGQCIDCTSNQVFSLRQYEYYTELAKPNKKKILQKATEFTTQLHDQFPEVTFEELAVEVGAVLLGHEMLPAFKRDLHIMANPRYAYSQPKVVEAAKRIHRISAVIDPSFPTSRIVIKVPATWEGMQACRELRPCGVKTLATTVFSMEQAVLAGEAGCVSISPFVHALRILVEPEYRDPHPLLDLCVQAQRWYQQESLPTKVKACSTVGVDELLQLAGVDALTLMPDDLRALQSKQREAAEVAGMSLFESGVSVEANIKYDSYIDDETKYRLHFERADRGGAQARLAEAIDIFRGYQAKAEDVIRSVKV